LQRIDADRTCLQKFLAGHNRERDRRFLQIFAALLGGDDDFFQAAIIGCRLSRACSRVGRLREGTRG
jgi:hypothetical protein